MPRRGGPRKPTDLPTDAWTVVLRRTIAEFRRSHLGDSAAALTYWATLSLFPGLLVVVSVLGVVGSAATQRILDNLRAFAPGAARDILNGAITQLQAGRGTGSVFVLVGLAGALWAASGYVGAFMRAANIVYDVPEGRPLWKTLPMRLAVTAGLLLSACLGALIVVFTGGAARGLGRALGAGDAALTVWSFAKWPVLAVLVVLTLTMLYRLAPDVDGESIRWLSPGTVLALVVWLASSAVFAAYVANFHSFNRAYGTLAGIAIFLVWQWLTNVAILCGLMFDAELARERARKGGKPHPAKRRERK
ncbi:YihY/virulence factor BrkB family protein [Yinghuangia seranimata]|uniref:YihY/virulence factor BrkB family protein n=1 Tax=Yinghuangia seranimata TaxID=408067 RepID=UPI00248ADB3C|nr:YihY/virulence factor BrkB family protein [Yinghuangia seranimata]MDI2125407.1 YihY/virulence factor BrkB family protein [Yinghuangia seranimata]